MKDYSRLFARTIRHTFDFTGRSARSEFLVYIVLSQVMVVLVGWPVGWFAPEETEGWVRFAIQFATVIPAFALVVRRLHDFGRDGRWSLILLAVALRTFALDLLGLIAGWSARSMVESPLAYVDWLLFPPFLLLYLLLLAAPGTKGGNRYGSDPREAPASDGKTAGPDGSGPAAQDIGGFIPNLFERDSISP
ncbi:Uncharacterized membrane protein YhaH, DUF805 family [Novosphingobium sp. CF614]|uniref:DUF805 domain-containing protein n=1 Tax=Novosphingobium sp. CF614 TaxID=1884364 RepID=UPI0008F06BBB|nr:DUF805 domain-containing protein [Novosphingobium sp. CF614]SFG24985.1 Uncharacterized membrane protein YhaH, DUF805 family [Novosphingobium sp. CF614]